MQTALINISCYCFVCLGAIRVHPPCYFLSDSPLPLVPSVSDRGRRAVRPADRHRAGSAGLQGGGDREEGHFLQEQRAPPLALHHPRPPGPGSQELLRQILRRVSRPHQ